MLGTGCGGGEEKRLGGDIREQGHVEHGAGEPLRTPELSGRPRCPPLKTGSFASFHTAAFKSTAYIFRA